jgi:heat shock protein HslJ
VNAIRKLASCTGSRLAACALATALSVLLAACEPQPEGPAVADATAQAQAPAPATDTVAKPELAGSSWQLVRIMSMDDSEIVPDDPSRYTLTFTDDSVNIGADCNRGRASYTSQSPGQLTFGVTAATRALCPPGSASDTYMSQFQWVRSYVLEDGNLFLATMADGAIIEFEPRAE